jgi:hypothetical protein
MVSVICFMYQFGTKPQPPMKSGDACEWVACRMCEAPVTPRAARSGSAASAAAICLAPQSVHLLR